jgi:hypothetical protein
MPIPWLRLIDLALGATSFSRGAQNRAALAEDVGRDARLLALEREQLEAERLRADRALQLERLGQACELEIGRLRLIAAVAVAAWLGTLFFLARVAGAGIGGRISVGAGWALLLAALASAFVGQANLARALDRDVMESGLAGALAPWLLVAGLAVIAAAALIA